MVNLNKYNLKVGDRIRILTPPPNVYYGWNNQMTPYIGKVLTIESLENRGVTAKNCNWTWSFENIEPEFLTEEYLENNKYAHINRKIKEMQRKRKEMGYAF